MKIVSSFEMKELDKNTIYNQNISSWQLMEKASNAFVNSFRKVFTTTFPVCIFCGPGNNGGDGLAIARMLLDQGYRIKVWSVTEPKSSDCKQNYEILKNFVAVPTISSVADFPNFEKNTIIIDALIGIGLKSELKGMYADLVDHINTSGLKIVSVDIASGLLSDRVTSGNKIIKPTTTISFQLPKLAFMLPENQDYVGELILPDIGLDKESIEKAPTTIEYLELEFIKPMIKKRSKYAHKGNYGRSLIIGGSYGMIGAVILASKACYTTGAGLVRAYIPACGYHSIQCAIPEVMVITDTSDKEITSVPDIELYNAIAVGPGMSEGDETKKALEQLLKSSKVPLVLDAGALNILSKNKYLFKFIPPLSILTPHPKEFERLQGTFKNEFERLDGLRNFAKEISCYVLLKGAHTAIAFPDGRLYFNSTGNAGMAKGGSGDVLTGIITGLLSQSYTPSEAVLLGVFMHGFAGDCAVKNKSEHSILASDIINSISDFYRAVL